MRVGPWLREIGLASLAGLVLGVSPFTPSAPAAKVAIGAAAAAGVMGWRVHRGALRRSAAAEEERTDTSLWLALATALLVEAAFAPSILWMYSQWTGSLWSNNHGIFMPFVIGYLGWDALRHDKGAREPGSAWGVLLVGAGLALAVLDSGAHAHYPALAGLLLSLPGLSLAFLGPRRTRMLRVPLLLSVLMIPIPVWVAGPLALRTLTASGVEPLLHLLGMTALRDGTLILLPHNVFVVADACSGFSTLYASLAMATILACYTAGTWRRLALFASAVPLALAANIVRVLILVLMTNFMGVWLLDTPIHEASGVATFVVVILALFLIAGRSSSESRSPA